MTPRKRATAKIPAGLKVQIGVSRGDLSIQAETAATRAADVARFLATVVREVTRDMPDLLPTADHVGGSAVEFTWGDHETDDGRRRVGFRRS